MEIKNSKYLISNADVNKCPDTDVPEYAFIGRSNVGKSSLINMLTRNKGLAKTSQTPGKTLLINHFCINDGDWNIVDLPGYGYAARGKKQREEIRRHKPQAVDLEFLRWLGENGVPFAIIFTKADKLSKTAGESNVSAYKKELMKEWEELPPTFITSSEKKTGRDEVLDYIDSINISLKKAKSQETPL